MTVTRTHRRHSLAELAMLTPHRATYRMLDYWARSGRIDLGTSPGTGNWRDLSSAEAAAVLDVIAENQRLSDALERIRSGDLFRERLAWHTDHPSDPWVPFIGAELAVIEEDFDDGEKPA